MHAFNKLSVFALTVILLSGSQGCIRPHRRDLVAEGRPNQVEQTPKVIKLGNVTVYPRERRIEVEALFCLEEGILEYLAVGESGKTYESVLQLDCEPSMLHAALLALGYEPGDVPEETKGDFTGGTSRRNPKSYLDIFVEWTEGEKTVRIRAEELLLSIADEKPADAAYWVFTGSHFTKDREGREWYTADIRRSIIAVWYDPSAVINFPVVTGNPYRGSSGFAVNSKIMPEGSKAKLIILPHKELESGKNPSEEP